VERCIGCRYYDRGKTRNSEHGALRRGQCRRTAPVLSPINIKGAAIEGIWPTIRDDDWCGEWQAVERRPQRTAPEPARAAFTARSDTTSELPMDPPAGSLAPPIDAFLGTLPMASAMAPMASAAVGAD
jgi:hypothetical protein